MATSSPPQSPPRGQRSLSYNHPSSPPSLSSASSRPLPPPLYVDASSADPSSSSSNAHASSSYHSSLATRTRSRSVGSKARADELLQQQQQPDAAGVGEELNRGPGTPDIILGGSLNRSSGSKAKGRIGQLMRGGQDGPSIPSARDGTTAGDASTSNRPRLTSRLRSFFTSFSAAESQLSSPDAGQPKARTSNEFKSSPLAQSRTDIGVPVAARPQGLVIPSARPALFGEFGLNDDSPPLTPLSEEEREYLKPSHQRGRRQWNGAYESSGSSTTDPTTSLTSLDSSNESLPQQAKLASMSLGTGGAMASGLMAPAFTHGPDHSFRASSRLSFNDLSERLQAGLRSKSLRQHMPTLLMLLTFFVFSTLVVFILLTTLPLRFPAHGLTQLSLAEIRDICMSLREYATSTSHAYHHTLLALCLFFTYLQAFNVPGSIICNVVFGALFGAWRATFWLSIFTAVGGSGAAVMSALVAPLVLKIPGMAKAVEVMRRALGNANFTKQGSTQNHGIPMRKRSPISPSSRSGTPRLRATSPHPSGKTKSHHGPKKTTGSNLFSVLLLLRLLPLTPYGMMNIACGILNVPLVPFASTLAVGSVPWNAVTAQLGEILLDVVAAFPVDDDEILSEADLKMTGPIAGSLGEQLDAGGFRNVARPGSAALASEGMRNMLTTEKSKLSSAAHKAGGGIKILLAKIWTREMILKLVGLSLLSITPVLLGRWWKARQARQAAAASKARKLRMASEREQQQQHLNPEHVPHSSMPVAAPSAIQPNPAAAVLNWSDGEHDDESSSYTGSYTRFDSGPEYDDGDEDDSTYEYDEDENDEGDDTIGGRASKIDFTAMAESTPAFIANLTRSASRNSWNSSWLKSAMGGSSPAKGDGRRHASPLRMSFDDGSRVQGSGWPGTEVTTPQLEMARNPFEAAGSGADADGSGSPTSKRASFAHERSPSGIDFAMHPALGGGVGHGGFSGHSRQSSQKFAESASPSGAGAGSKREPKRLHATLNA